MEKIALYRKYRPKNFSEVLGQIHVTKTLENALKEGRASHAYLFTGPRGVGKTTVARILATAINCEKRKGGEPCGSCENCKMILAGKAIDILEIDAASNRGIDEIRELKEKIKFSPSKLKYKVFIVDEVHMLTKEAFNALLKTLEEPPEYALFVLATTEIHKVPQTILSRCQRFDFKRISLKDLAEKLQFIAKEEKIKISKDAISMIAEASDGGMRDAESYLDQIASYKESGEIEVKDIIELLGMSDFKNLYNLISALKEGKAKEAIIQINELAENGADLDQFIKNLVEYLRKVLHIKVVGDSNIQMTEEHFELTKKLAKDLDLAYILEMIKTVLNYSNAFKNLPLPQLPLEMAIVSLTEGRVGVTKTAEKYEREGEVYAKEDRDIKGENIDGEWPDFLLEVKSQNNSIHALLKVCSYEIKGDELCLYFPYKFHKERIEDIKNKKIVEKALNKVFNRDLKVKCFIKNDMPKPEEAAKTETELLEKALDIFGGEVVN
ncbi:MAG: DNA polymerase III subunit gamma/tau [Patescibacteria group bacterium]|nr:DNA polymerase III subunit gamma/tau [Patescibacteria group bacterium]